MVSEASGRTAFWCKKSRRRFGMSLVFKLYMRWFAMASVRGFLAFGEKRVFLQGGLCGFGLK